MDYKQLVPFTVFIMFSSAASVTAHYGAGVFPVTTNCSAGTQSCGPEPSCCSMGLECNYSDGIPICQNFSITYVEGFDHLACLDPYLYDCSAVLGIPGFCCPIGSICYTEITNNIVRCIDELGTTQSAFPSATTGLVPTSTPIPGGDSALVYSPSDAWNISSPESNCTTSGSLHVTDTLNATITFNYTGPSIIVHTVTSSDGGVFALIVDGFNTSSLIDTYGGPGSSGRPTCYPLQFPPFIETPPGYENSTNHTLTLVFVGVSDVAPNGTNTSTGHFDSVAIPNLGPLLLPASKSSATSRLTSLDIYAISILLLLSLLSFI